jgi:hypothetical protein
LARCCGGTGNLNLNFKLGHYKLNIEKVDRTTGTEIVTEVRIAMACAEKEGINSFVEKAICVTTLSHFVKFISKIFKFH